MISQQRFISFLLPLVAALAAAALTGCVLDMATKDSCEVDNDCIEGYSCTGANVCEATITLGPDATPVGPDAEVEDGGGYDSDADPLDGGGYDSDADTLDGGGYDSDADPLDGGAPDADTSDGGAPDADTSDAGGY